MADKTNNDDADVLADQAADQQDAELSDEILDNVAGGAATTGGDVEGSRTGRIDPGGVHSTKPGKQHPRIS